MVVLRTGDSMLLEEQQRDAGDHGRRRHVEHALQHVNAKHVRYRKPVLLRDQHRPNRVRRRGPAEMCT